MIAMLRATARIAFPGVWQTGVLFVLVYTMANMSAGTRLDGVEGALFLGSELLMVGFLGLYLRGRAIGPSGMPTFAVPMPALPVSRATRAAAVVVVGEALLLAASVAFLGLQANAHRTDPRPDVFVLSGMAFTDAPSLAAALLSLALLSAPLLVAGSEGGVGIRAGRALLYALGLAGLAALRVDQSLPLVAAWCVVGLVVLPRIPAGTRDDIDDTYPRFGRGLLGVFATQGLWSLPILLAVAVVGLGMSALALPGWQAMVTWATVVTAAMLPAVPTSFEAGTLQPTGVGALAALPVSRSRAVLSIFAAAVARVGLAAGLGSLWIRLSGAAADAGPLDHPFALLSGTMCVTAALHLAGLRHRPLLALGGTVLGMVSLVGDFGNEMEVAPEVRVALPALAGLYAVSVAVQACRRGLPG